MSKQLESLLDNAKGNYAEVLTLAEMQATAPGIFATRAHPRMSENYRFVPTSTVLEALVKEGFLPVKVQQSRKKVAGGPATSRHMIRLRHHSFMQNLRQEIPELVLLNSHDGSCTYQLYAGIFRFVCSNGMIVTNGSFGAIKARHAGAEDLVEQIIDGSYKLVADAPEVMAMVDTFKSVPMNRMEQLAFAQEASELRKTKVKLSPASLLTAVRDEDAAKVDEGVRDLWTTYNVVQEKLIKGGKALGVGKSGRVAGMRQLSNLQQDVQVNKGLWALTEKYARQPLRQAA